MPRLLSSSDSVDSDSYSQGVTFDPDTFSETSSIPSLLHRARSSVHQAAYSYPSQRQTYPAPLPYHSQQFSGRNPSEASSEARETSTEVAASDFSDFQQSTESGSDSFQEESFFSRDLYRFNKSTQQRQNEPGNSAHKKEKKSLQREFDDLLRKYRKGHLMKIHRTFIRLWRTGALCDVILKTADTQIPVHSAVVVGHSGLCEKQCRDFHTSNTLPIVISLPNKLTTNGVKLVTDFMYLAKIEIDLVNIVQIYEVAKILEVYVLSARCNKILDRMLEDQNIVQTIQAATELGNEELQQIAWSKFTKDFKVFCSKSSFQEQTLQNVIKVLSADHLLVKSEFEVFEAAIAWINHKRNERLRHLPRLMDCVRLIFMTDEELINCMQYDQAFSAPPGLEILAQANMNKMLKDRSELPSNYPLPRNRIATSQNRCADGLGTYADLRQRVPVIYQTQSVPAVLPKTTRKVLVDWRQSSPMIGPPAGSPFRLDRPLSQHAPINSAREENSPRSLSYVAPSSPMPNFLLPEF